MCQRRINGANAARNHDRLVVTPALACDGLLKRAKVAVQVRAAKLVVERSSAQRPFGHDLPWRGHVAGQAGVVRRCVCWLFTRSLSKGLAGFSASGRTRLSQRRHGKARQTGLGFGSAPGRTFVAYLATRAGAGTGEGADGSGVVMRFYLHQHMPQATMLFVAACATFQLASGIKGFRNMAFHDGRVVGIGHDGVLRCQRMGVANHAEQAFVLRLPVDGELGVEYLVAAVLAVGLGKHHQLHIRGVARQGGEGVYQIDNFVFSQCQAKLGVGFFQRGAAFFEYIDILHRRSL